MKRIIVLSLVLTLTFSMGNIFSQESANTDTIAQAIEKLQSDVNVLSRLKISGFVQAQWQKSDTIGSPAGAAGGNFSNLDNRFMVRRARLKAVYTGEQTQVVLQADFKDAGTVLVKEAYGVYTEPWLNTVSLTAGFFSRPIGQEVEYSSSSLESPERARIIQTLFPDEVDQGAKLTIQAPKTHPLNFLKLDAGLFTGNAIGPETDKYKDFIGHFSMKKLISNDITLIAGVSYYNGGFALTNSNSTFKGAKPAVWSMQNGAFAADSSGKAGDKVKREYFGVDLQFVANSTAGITMLRGEYLFGQQPGTAGSTTSAKGGTAINSASTDVYVRNFAGGYVMLVQRIMQSKHEFVVKYDWYDPNTNIAIDDIGSATAIKTSATDAKFSTIGLGWNYYASPNFKLTVYKDFVSNETSANLKSGTNGTNNYRTDLKDNVLTIRAQYRF